MNGISNTPAISINNPASHSPLPGTSPTPDRTELDDSPCNQTVKGKRKITVRDKLNLVMAARSGHFKDVAQLLHKGVDIHKECYLRYQDSPLKVAVKHRRFKIMELLLEHGANPDDHAAGAKTPLRSVFRKRPISNKIIEMLLKFGAHPDARVCGCATPLYVAASGGHLNAIKLLLQYGADVNGNNSGMQTPLYIAVRNGRIRIAKLLLECGADVNGKSLGLSTPLSIAVQSGCLRRVKLLLDHHADVNSIDARQVTTLELAAWQNRVDMAFELLRRGALAHNDQTRKLVKKVIRKYKINPETTPLSLKGSSLRVIGKHLNGRNPKNLPLPECSLRELRLQNQGKIFP
ncbi:ankyrin repeat domain-containing protein [Endozoicomonas sp. SESOKO1]|uniref:ankyrin repeat domain-containing protein n=1 Tax=Endozoicomonas sp. SESOKO1 TaxID=2828742 RepID=UPI002148DDAC|nr:ankyrin repeat domain-containing protein [Endozoicomonas sp. SESOKO1]